MLFYFVMLGLDVGWLLVYDEVIVGGLGLMLVSIDCIFVLKKEVNLLMLILSLMLFLVVLMVLLMVLLLMVLMFVFLLMVLMSMGGL